MTAATTRVERSGPAICATLAEASSEECAAFEAEFAQALPRASAELDLVPAEEVLDHWWGIAVIRANPLSEKEQAQVVRELDPAVDAAVLFRVSFGSFGTTASVASCDTGEGPAQATPDQGSGR